MEDRYVYLVCGHDFDEFVVVGVCRTKEEAERFVKEPREGRYGPYTCYYQQVEVLDEVP